MPPAYDAEAQRVLASVRASLQRGDSTITTGYVVGLLLDEGVPSEKAKGKAVWVKNQCGAHCWRSPHLGDQW
eukprot:gene6537-24870_t